MNHQTSTTVMVLWLSSNKVVHVFILTSLILSIIISSIGNCLRGLDIAWWLLKWRYHHKVLPKPSSMPTLNCCLSYSIQVVRSSLRWTCYVKLVWIFKRTINTWLCFAPRDLPYLLLWELLVGKLHHLFLPHGCRFYEHYHECNMWLFNFHSCTFLFIQFLLGSFYLILYCFYLWLYLWLSIVKECSAPLA